MNINKLMHLNEVAATLKVNRRTVNRLIKDGQLPPPVYLCGRAYLTVTDIERFVAEQVKKRDAKLPQRRQRVVML